MVATLKAISVHLHGWGKRAGVCVFERGGGGGGGGGEEGQSIKIVLFQGESDLPSKYSQSP